MQQNVHFCATKNATVEHMSQPLDQLDVHIIAELRRHPRTSMADLARSLGVARGTVYARLDRLENTGTISGYGPDIAPSGVGLGRLGVLHARDRTRVPRRDSGVARGDRTELGDTPGDRNRGLCTAVSLPERTTISHEVLQLIAAIPTVLRSQTQPALLDGA